VKLLAEMSPKANSNVLGVNINKSTIKIRLRVSKDGGFYPYSHHLGTMLHELAHMRYGNHSAEFYDLLKDLRNDMEKILNGRMTVPFAEAGCGIRLGGKRPRNSREIRSARLQNLENRGRYRNLIGTGPYRLGSGTTNPTTTTTTTTTTTVHKNKRRKLKRTSTPPAKRREKLVNAVMRRTKKKKTKKTNDDIIDLTENDDSIYVIV